MISTKLRYMFDAQLFTSSAICHHVEVDERGPYMVFDQTIFHPQGGGQPCDLGTIGLEIGDKIDLVGVYTSKDATPEVRHYTASHRLEDCRKLIGLTITQQLDEYRRKQNSRLHSAGHLIAAVVESWHTGLVATRGHHFPNEAYVEFTLDQVETASLEKRLETISQRLSDLINNDAPVTLAIDREGLARKQQRTVAMGDFKPVGCGGTHVSTLKEIGTIEIRGMKLKTGRLKVSYQTSQG